MKATEPPGSLDAGVPSGTPTLKRRLTAMLYECFLLFAVEMLAVLLYILVTGNRQEALFQHGLKLHRIGQIAFAAVQCSQNPQRRQRALQLPANLAVFAKQENLFIKAHAYWYCFSTQLRYSPLVTW